MINGRSAFIANISFISINHHSQSAKRCTGLKWRPVPIRLCKDYSKWLGRNSSYNQAQYYWTRCIFKCSIRRTQNTTRHMTKITWIHLTPSLEFHELSSDVKCTELNLKLEDVRDKMRNGLSGQSLLIFMDIISVLKGPVTDPPFSSFAVTSINYDTSFATFNGYEW